MKVVVLTGPESAGKSTLCSALAQRFQAPVVREYVREYMHGLGRETCLADVTPIAQVQWQREQAARALRPPLLLLDTHLLSNCRIPDDCIDKNRYPLFMARSVLRELIESLPSTRSL